MDAQIFNEAFADFRGVLDQAAKPTRQYNKQTDKPIYKPEHARFKLVIWFKDGNTRYYYSFDHVQYKDGVFIDEFEGLKKLIRLINKYEGTYKNAIIYANLDEKNDAESSHSGTPMGVDISGLRLRIVKRFCATVARCHGEVFRRRFHKASATFSEIATRNVSG